jgi:hypothetical protein
MGTPMALARSGNVDVLILTFAAPLGNGRYLRIPAGWSRRIADIETSALDGLSWAGCGFRPNETVYENNGSTRVVSKDGDLLTSAQAWRSCRVSGGSEVCPVPLIA